MRHAVGNSALICVYSSAAGAEVLNTARIRDDGLGRVVVAVCVNCVRHTRSRGCSLRRQGAGRRGGAQRRGGATRRRSRSDQPSASSSNRGLVCGSGPPRFLSCPAGPTGPRSRLVCVCLCLSKEAPQGGMGTGKATGPRSTYRRAGSDRAAVPDRCRRPCAPCDRMACGALCASRQGYIRLRVRVKRVKQKKDQGGAEQRGEKGRDRHRPGRWTLMPRGATRCACCSLFASLCAVASLAPSRAFPAWDPALRQRKGGCGATSCSAMLDKHNPPDRLAAWNRILAASCVPRSTCLSDQGAEARQIRIPDIGSFVPSCAWRIAQALAGIQ